MYQARILDKNRQLKAILPGVHWRYVRRRNETTDVEVYIPRETVEEHISEGHVLYGFFAAQPFAVEIAAFIQIWQIDELKLASDPQASVVDPTFPALNVQAFDISTASTHKVSGKIISRDVGQVVVVKALTEEILFETNVTPAQYGKVWEGWDLADLVRDNLDGWRTLRVKAPEQWQTRLVSSSNVDLTTDPGIVMLAKQSNGRYYDSGYIVLLFDPSEVSKFKQWDRLRWSADSDGALSAGEASPVVQTTIQWSADGSNWSAPWDGGLPEEVGLVPGVTSEPLYVRINLITNDTESEDANGEPVGVTPYVFACEAIARTHGELVAGEIPDVAGVTVGGINGNRAPSLAVVQSACAQAEWEFEVVNGTVRLAQHLGTDRSSDILLRAGTNMEVASLGDDDDELVNILTAQGPGSGINRMEITLRDEVSIAEYGPYPNREPVEFEVETLTELMQKAQEYLDTHNTPATHFAVSVAFPHDKEPEYGIGDTVKVVDPETGIVTTARILEDQREYSDSGLSVLLELGKAGVDITHALYGRKPPKKPVAPTQPLSVWARGIIDGIQVGFSTPQFEGWAYTECHMSTEPAFVPSSTTLVDIGQKTKFDVVSLESGNRYYFCVIHVDRSRRRSLPSQVVSAIPISVTDSIGDGTIPNDKLKDAAEPPDIVTGLTSFPGYKLHVVQWSVSPRAVRYFLDYSTDGENWTRLNVGNTTQYPHSGLDLNWSYQYRVVAQNIVNLNSDPSETHVAGQPGKIAVSQEIVDEYDWENWLENAEPLQSVVADVEGNTQQISAVSQTADEISSTVTALEDEVSEQSTTIQQTAESIALRLDGDQIKTPAGITIGQVDGQGYLLLNADSVNLLSDRYTLNNTGLEVIDTNDNPRVKNGDVSGKQWGDGVLPNNTFGVWGDEAGVFLRGYARLLAAGSVEDEQEIDLTDFSNLIDPEVLVAPKELVSYSPESDTLSHLYVDAVKVPNNNKYIVKAKTMVKGTSHSWGGRSETHKSWTFTRPTESIDGRKGVYTDFFICRPGWRVASGGFGSYTARLWMDITDEFNTNGDPINWETIRTFSRSSKGSGTLNWDTALPHFGQWALRVRGQGGGALIIKYAFTRLVNSGYRTGDTYLDVDGQVITDSNPANTPSGMSALYFVFDKG